MLKVQRAIGEGREDLVKRKAQCELLCVSQLAVRQLEGDLTQDDKLLAERNDNQTKIRSTTYGVWWMSTVAFMTYAQQRNFLRPGATVVMSVGGGGMQVPVLPIVESRFLAQPIQYPPQIPVPEAGYIMIHDDNLYPCKDI